MTTKKKIPERIAANPLVFMLDDPADLERYNSLRPASSSPLSESARLKFSEIQRTWRLDDELLLKYKNHLEKTLEELDSLTKTLGGTHRAIFNNRVIQLLDDADLICSNAAKAYLVHLGETAIARRVKGGKSTAGKEKPSSRPWHEELIRFAKQCKQTRQSHEITGICAQRFGKSTDAVRKVLQEAEILKKRKKP